MDASEPKMLVAIDERGILRLLESLVATPSRAEALPVGCAGGAETVVSRLIASFFAARGIDAPISEAACAGAGPWT